MVDVAHRVARFLHVESCGQCTPCKTGSGAVNTAFEQLVLDGALGSRASNELERALQTITDGSRCFLPQQVRTVIPSLLAAFPDDLEERLAGRTGDIDVPFPKLVDLADGVATVDESIDRKLPDWTYSEVPVRLGRRAEPTA
jgi:NADH-quinone oxidoreductase subunit F